MIRIGICDDSPAFLQQTKHILDGWVHRPQDITTDFFEDGDALLTAHAQKPFDIILLDIVMPLLNGIDTARELREKDRTVKIVFLTSSAEFAVDSYSVKASNYLLKPVVPDTLLTCLEELIREIRSVSRCLTVRGLDAVYRVPISSIEYVESQSKHILFSTTEGRIIKSTEPLYAYENTLLLKDGFFKCHRSYIVNIHHIDSYSSSGAVMRSGCQIPISRSRQKNFEDAYFSVVFEKAGDDF